jgi:hypothetical protein
VHAGGQYKLRVRDAAGTVYQLRAPKFVLSAGTVDSAAILLRSRMLTDESGKPMVKAPNLTDHSIYGATCTIGGEHGGAVHTDDLLPSLKLDVEGVLEYTEDGCVKRHCPFLLNICINVGSYLARNVVGSESHTAMQDRNTCSMAYQFLARLNEADAKGGNYVTLEDSSGAPAIRIRNTGNDIEHDKKAGEIAAPGLQESLMNLSITIVDAIKQYAHTATGKEHHESWVRLIQERPAGPGVVAHEVGTLAIGHDAVGVVGTNLNLRKHPNIHVCDLSVLPVSAPANPSLTLVALALRLADLIYEEHSSKPPSCAS